MSIQTKQLPRAVCWTVAAATFMTIAASPAGHALETQSYAVEWFSVSSYSQDGDCPGGVNPPTRVQYAESYELLGYSPEEVATLMRDQVSEDRLADARATDILRFRGRLNGQPVNAFVHPWAVADPELTAVDGKFSFGFNLDGQVGPRSFTEPMTKEVGIDNELFRALGCVEQFRGTFNFRPTFWAFIWGIDEGNHAGVAYYGGWGRSRQGWPRHDYL